MERNETRAEDHGTLADLPRHREFTSKKVSGNALMVKRLPVAADQLDLLTETSLCRNDTFRIQLCEQEV